MWHCFFFCINTPAPRGYFYIYFGWFLVTVEKTVNRDNSDHLKNFHPKLEWGDNSSAEISWGDNSTGGNLWGDNSSGGNYEEKTMKQAII